MRQGSNPKRPRGRTGRKNPNPRSQSFESNGPEVKVRGNAQQVVEKYLALARDSATAGNRVQSESYFQHAEHYYRLMTANGGPEVREMQARLQGDDYDDGSQPVVDGATEAPSPALDGAPVTNGAAGSVSDPASAPQPDSDTARAAQAE
jgi:hypothetical protein